MKTMKKLLMAVICLMLIQMIGVSAVPETTTVYAATVKKGLKKENGKYYYYKDGKKLKNTWKSVTSTTTSGKKVTYKYYFGKDGAAYAAPVKKNLSYNFVVKTIGDKKYGFNNKGRMITGLYVSASEKFYYFNSNGVYSAATSKKYNAAAVYGQSYTALKTLLKNRTIKKTSVSSSCYMIGGKDYKFYYDHFMVNTMRDKSGKKEVFSYIESR